jgi:hypothetical protein
MMQLLLRQSLLKYVGASVFVGALEGRNVGYGCTMPLSLVKRGISKYGYYDT